MVQLMNSDNLQPESEKPCQSKLSVKLEIEDSLDEEHGPLNKRSKLPPYFPQQWSTVGSIFPTPPSQYNPLDDPSPLGLQLKKSPSFLDLIQMRLSQGIASALGDGDSENLELGKKNIKGAGVSGVSDKLKASNFPVSLLRIGTWECISRYEGDLVAKCYYAKQKLVWEVLEGGLKSKIEIQWSDITSLKATCPDSGPGTLDIVLARQPLFFRETNPQPRKHTLWQATSDFTGGQASLHRRHFLQCPHGLLSKHFEKLIQCDPRLNLLSQHPEMMLDSPCFEPRVSVFEESEESKCHGFDPLNSDYVSTFSGFRVSPSQSAGQTSSLKSEIQDPVCRGPDTLPRETPSPSSVMDTHAIEDNGSGAAEKEKMRSHWDKFNVPGLHASMSMSDLLSHIGHCISEQISSENPSFSIEGLQNKKTLEEITQHLLSDTQLTESSDEKSLMSRVNSLCCLLQKDPSTVQSLQGNNKGGLDSISESTRESELINDFTVPKEESNDISDCKQTPAMSRKDSLGDLLLNLPRIASFPQFLFNIAEDDKQARW